MTTTNNSQPFTRAEKRRLWKEVRRNERYEHSGFMDLGWGWGVDKLSRSKYVPHIGNKQKGKHL